MKWQRQVRVERHVLRQTAAVGSTFLAVHAVAELITRPVAANSAPTVLPQRLALRHSRRAAA